MPTWPRARSSRSPARTAVSRRDDPVGGRDDVEQRAWRATRGRSPRRRPASGPCRTIVAEQAFEHLARGGFGDGRAVIGPVLEHDEGARLGAARVRRRPRTWRWCGPDRGSRRRIAAPPSAARRAPHRRLGAGPEPAELGARLVREAVEMPGRGEGGDAARRCRAGRRRAPSCRRGNSRPGRRARRVRAISGSRICSTWPATDSVAPVRRPASPSRAAAPAGPRPASQRSSERSPMSSTLGGLISEGTNSTRAGPSPP